MKIAIVYSNYYEEISDGLLKGVYKAAKIDKEIEFTEFVVPGTFEIPLQVKRVIKDFDAVITLGCVVQGETYHHDLINNSVSSALMNISLESLKPVGFGILTTKNYKQAQERVGEFKNKGKETFLAVYNMI